MKDPALIIWATALVLTVPVFVFPAEVIIGWTNNPDIPIWIVRVITLAYSALILTIAYSRYTRIAAKTANAAANYDSVKEAVDDVDGDIATQNILLSITVVSLTIPFVAAACFWYTGAIVEVWGRISLDWILGYIIFCVFNAAMSNIRKYELHLTVENTLNRMREQNPGIFRKE